jgi:DNA polymerase-1
MRVTTTNLNFVLARLFDENTLALDTETTGLEETDRPFSFQVATNKEEYYFDSRVIPNLWGMLEIRSFLSSDRTWILQNPKFDMRMLDSVGCPVGGRIIDLTIAARLVRNDHLTYSLDAQAKRYGMAKDDKVKQYIKDNNLYSERIDQFGKAQKNPQYDQVPIELMEEYGCRDVRVTYNLYVNHYLPIIGCDTGLSSSSELESDLTRACYAMERRGIELDRQYTVKAMQHESHKLKVSKARFSVLLGAQFKNSAKYIQGLIKTQLPKTDEGNPSLDDEVLESLLHCEDKVTKGMAEIVREIRRSDKLIGTYYKNYLNLVDSNGFIHPNMWPGGTRTGRFSYSDPNLQNLHKDKGSTAEYVVRGCFKPRSGHAFLAFDYEQMEYKVMAAYANDQRIIKKVMAGADFHQAIADQLGIDRDKAKTLNFACLYGSGADQIGNMLGISSFEARTLKTKYFLGMPKVDEFIAKVINAGRTRGYVTTWSGRKLYCEPEFAYALPNHLIQGGCADIVKRAMVELHKTIPHIPMVLQIHDELVFDAPIEYITDKAIQTIKSIMQNAFPEKNGLRLTVDASISFKSLAKRDFEPITNKEFPCS